MDRLIKVVVRRFSVDSACDQLETLRRFQANNLYTPVDMRSAIDAVSDVVESCTARDSFRLGISAAEMLTPLLSISGLALVIIFCRVKWTLSSLIKRALPAGFLLSVIFKLIRDYQLAVVKQYAVLIEENNSCLPTYTVSDAVYALLSYVFLMKKESPCQLAIRALFTNAVFELSPLSAIAITVTQFLLEPFVIVAETLNKMLRALLNDMPIVMLPLIVIFGCCVVVIIILIPSILSPSISELISAVKSIQRENARSVIRLKPGGEHTRKPHRRQGHLATLDVRRSLARIKRQLRDVHSCRSRYSNLQHTVDSNGRHADAQNAETNHKSH